MSEKYQDISIGVKVSESLIEEKVALEVAKALEGNTEEMMTKIITGIMKIKKGSYSSDPTFIQQIVAEKIQPIIKAEAEKYLDTMGPDISRLIQKQLRQIISKDNVIQKISDALAATMSKSIRVEIY